MCSIYNVCFHMPRPVVHFVYFPFATFIPWIVKYQYLRCAKYVLHMSMQRKCSDDDRATKRSIFFFAYRPNLFAVCNNTFSKWWEGLRMSCRRVLSSTPLLVRGSETV
jgi:hypothetical protein